MPDFFKDPSLFTFSWLSTDGAKIEFLRAEYKKYLNDSKMQILTTHFRHYRTYKPNELEVALLQHKLSCLWPNYSSFKYHMDDPTKTVAEYLKQRLRYFPEKHEAFIKNKLEALRVFNQPNFDKYHSKTQGGWHTTIIEQLSVDEEKEYRVMSLLLLDKEKYGC